MAVRLQRPPVVWACTAFSCCSMGASSGPDPRSREVSIESEASMQTGGRMVSTDAERRSDASSGDMKRDEVSRRDFPPAMHFFRARRLIQTSPVFRSSQKMPKGAASHVHDFSMVDVEWSVKNATYRPHCYMCSTDDASVRFVFSSRWPTASPRCSAWVSSEKLRSKMVNTTDSDNSIMANSTLFTERDAEVAFPTQDAVWARFEQAFRAVWGSVTFAPVFRDYYYRGSTQFYADNVMYSESRALLPQVYESDGSSHDRAWTSKTYRDVTEQFVSQHPDFYGARIIVTNQRRANRSAIAEAVEEAVQSKKTFPDFMAGFDSVGREDRGRPSWYFRDASSSPAEKGVVLPYFFHAGETDLEGTEVDQNSMDALLSNTSRIGHGFASVRHPVAKDLSRKRGVAVEVCPISNQVSKSVRDLRNHPAATSMSENHPMVISSDDPAMFGSAGLSYDFYEAFVGFGGSKSHIGSLKQSASNSIRYSSLPPQRQEEASVSWQRRWTEFVTENAFSETN